MLGLIVWAILLIVILFCLVPFKVLVCIAAWYGLCYYLFGRKADKKTRR